MRNTSIVNSIFVFCCVLFMGFSLDATAAGKIETVEVTGMGATQEKAIKNATKEAVRQVVGMYVVSEAVTKNRKLIKDEVLSASNGFVRKFTTIEKEVDEDGIHTVTARVEVEVGKVTEKLTGLNIATKKIDSDNLTAQVISKAETAKDFMALAQKVIFDPIVENKGMYKIEVNFFNDLVSDDDFDDEKWMGWAKFDSHEIIKSIYFPGGLSVAEDWVPIQMTMKVSIKNEYFDGVAQFLDKNSTGKPREGRNPSLNGKRLNTVMMRDHKKGSVKAWKLGKQNAKSMLKANLRFGANYETYLKLTLLGEDERILGEGTYVKGTCPGANLGAGPMLRGGGFQMIPPAPKYKQYIQVKKNRILFPNQGMLVNYGKIKQYVPRPDILSTRLYAVPSNAKYDFSKGGRVTRMVPCGQGIDYAAINLGWDFVYAPGTKLKVDDGSIGGADFGGFRGPYGVGMTIFEKNTDLFTFFNIIFLPPEDAMQLKMGKVEIITVQTNEDEEVKVPVKEKRF